MYVLYVCGIEKFTEFLIRNIFIFTGRIVIVGENINDGGDGKGVDFLGVYVCMVSLVDSSSGEMCGAGAIRSGISAKLLELNISSRIEPVIATKV